MATVKDEDPQFKPIEYREGDWNNWYYRHQQLMIAAHNVMIRGMDSIYAQAYVPKTNAEKASFAGYILAWAHLTKHHHEAEERFLFPECEKRLPGSMQMNLDQHHSFLPGFDTLNQWAEKVKADPSTYDGDKVVGMLDQFGVIFTEHLTLEIDTISPERMQQIWQKPDEAKTCIEEMTKWAVSQSSSFLDVPFVLTHHDVDETPWWPAIDVPWPVMILAKYVFPWWNQSYWRWSPCTWTMHRKPGTKIGHIKFSKGP